MTSNWFSLVHNEDKRLCISNNKSTDDIDREMEKGKSRKILELCEINQKNFEYFIEKYGEEYEFLSFFWCPMIFDFSPLEKLESLQGVSFFWRTKADGLWDMSHNPKLEYLWFDTTKKLVYNPVALQKAKSVKEVFFRGDMDSPYPMQSLEWMKGMDSLEKVYLRNIKLENRDTDVLENVPHLQRFDFPAGMFTTEEIAYICAKYPHILGDALCAYNTEDATLNDVRVCGYRKPGLDLPRDQLRLNKYIKEFDALVEKYKTELKNNNNT